MKEQEQQNDQVDQVDQEDWMKWYDDILAALVVSAEEIHENCECGMMCPQCG